MATGFTESYIRLWSLNGKGLRALRTDLTGDEVNKTTNGAPPNLFFFPSSFPSRLVLLAQMTMTTIWI